MSTPGGSGWGSSVWAGGSSATGGGSQCTIPAGRAVLYPALRKAGITLGPQRTPSPAQYQDAIEEFNRLISSLECDRLFIYSRDIWTFPLTGEKSYTIGQSNDGTVSDFDAPRPQFIESANVVSDGTPPMRYPLAIADDLAWAKVRVQDIPNGIPTSLYWDKAYPVSTIYLYPQPIGGYSLELYVWHMVPQVTTSEDVICLPAGYEDCLVLNLAVRLAPHFQHVVDPDVRQQARESLMRVLSLNAPRPIADTGSGCRGWMNIYTGEIY